MTVLERNLRTNDARSRLITVQSMIALVLRCLNTWPAFLILSRRKRPMPKDALFAIFQRVDEGCFAAGWGCGRV